MDPIHLQATIGSNGTLEIKGLPFQPGSTVEVSLTLQPNSDQRLSHPLAGTSITYIDPFEPAIPAEDWEAMQ